MEGLSPRGRGKRAAGANRRVFLRSIPAWAGETAGQHYGLDSGEGLSPRGRGKPLPGGLESPQPGSIPAWAGETGGRGAIGATPWVYPRVGGGNRALF